jgi:hypothetical protein
MLCAGIVGLPNVGKSTLFNAVTQTRKAMAANYRFCTIEPNQGIVTVPDERLEVQHGESHTLGHVNNRTTRRIPAAAHPSRPFPIQARVNPTANPIDGNGHLGKDVVFDPREDHLDALNAFSGMQQF